MERFLALMALLACKEHRRGRGEGCFMASLKAVLRRRTLDVELKLLN